MEGHKGFDHCSFLIFTWGNDSFWRAYFPDGLKGCQMITHHWSLGYIPTSLTVNKMGEDRICTIDPKFGPTFHFFAPSMLLKRTFHDAKGSTTKKSPAKGGGKKTSGSHLEVWSPPTPGKCKLRSLVFFLSIPYAPIPFDSGFGYLNTFSQGPIWSTRA